MGNKAGALSFVTNKFSSNIKWFPIKFGLSPPNKLFYLLQQKPFKNDETYFLFHLESFFRSQGIYIFVLTFWPCRKNGLIRKIKLVSKFMTSQPG